MEIAKIRSHFPGLSQGSVMLDNAAGSQMLGSAIDQITSYLTTCNVSVGYPHRLSVKSTAQVDAGYEATARFMNASVDEVIFGSSTTQLVRNLSQALTLESGDEIVLSKIDHEAHLAAWVHTAKRKGLVVRWWVPSNNTKSNPKLEAEDLERQKLVNEKTRLICFTNTSNILGSITDVRSIVRKVKEINPRTLISVDGVAYAPHAPIDVQAFGVDFYFFSWYKVYGPHLATAFVRKSAQSQLDSLGHYFFGVDKAQHLLELSGFSYELVSSLPAVVEYVESVGWELIKEREQMLQAEVLKYICTREEIQLFGEPRADRDLRVSVISFKVGGQSSANVVQAIYDKSSCTPTFGHFYAKRLIENVLGLEDPDDGIVRCSFLHYNTLEEARYFVSVLDTVLNDLCDGSHGGKNSILLSSL